jgi:hypothetical protein
MGRFVHVTGECRMTPALERYVAMSATARAAEDRRAALEYEQRAVDAEAKGNRPVADAFRALAQARWRRAADLDPAGGRAAQAKYTP